MSPDSPSCVISRMTVQRAAAIPLAVERQKHLARPVGALAACNRLMLVRRVSHRGAANDSAWGVSCSQSVDGGIGALTRLWSTGVQ
jgi:hypothetical protein